VSRPPLEVADIIHAHAADFLESRGGVVSSAKKKVLHKLAVCRTAVLGGHALECSHRCGFEKIAYNSCGDRHCPKCQAAARAQWLEAREADLLPVEYFHVVFTIPAALAKIALQNKLVMYGILFEASARTLKKIAADPKHLGAELGFIGLLHTWGQNLQHHPHIHYVIPGGGLSADRERWISCPSGFFLPVRVLSKVFRGIFLELTRKAFAKGRLTFQGCLAPLQDPEAFAAHLAPAYATDWVVYAKPPFGGPAQVLKYLARYTHRVAISNHRLLSLQDGKVSFRWKDYAHGDRQRTLTLSATEFLRRFLLHVLPKGFVRIRHFGFLANPVRVRKLELCRTLLGVADMPVVSEDVEHESGEHQEHEPGSTCPECGLGILVRRKLQPVIVPYPCFSPPGIDSS